MKLKYLEYVLILGLIFAVSYLYFGKNKTGKVAYIRTSVVLDKIADYSGAHAEFEKSTQVWDRQLKDDQDSIKSLVMQMDGKEGIEHPELLPRMKQKLDSMQNSFERYQGFVKRSAEVKQKELLDPIIASVNKYADQLVKQKGYSMILGTMQGGNIISADTTDDLTDQFVDGLKDQFRRLPVDKNSVPKN